MTNRDVLDVGCGTGLALDYANLPPVTPGSTRRRRCSTACWCGIRTRRSSATSLASFMPPSTKDTIDRYDLVLALFGVGGYLSDRELAAFRSSCGRVAAPWSCFTTRAMYRRRGSRSRIARGRSTCFRGRFGGSGVTSSASTRGDDPADGGGWLGAPWRREGNPVTRTQSELLLARVCGRGARLRHHPQGGLGVAASLRERPLVGSALVEPSPLTAEAIAAVHDRPFFDAVRTGHPRELATSSGLGWDAGL